LAELIGRVRDWGGVAVLCTVLLGGCTWLRVGPDEPPTAVRSAGAPADSARASAPGGAKAYDRVVTSEARTSRGLFVTHQIGEKLLFEIPRRELDTDMLLVTRGSAGSVFSRDRVVRWERSGNRVLLREQTYRLTADSTQAIHSAVQAQRFGPIIATFAIETFGPDSALVIDVSRLYTTNITEFAGVNGLVTERTFIESVAANPESIEIEATQTGSVLPPPTPGLPSAPNARPVTASARVHWSMVRLPREPMMARLRDRRVGYIYTTVLDYGRPEHRAVERDYIVRYRLEKRDPNAAISEPVKPIVFYIDPAMPRWMVPWAKKAVAAWQPAFEAAGFRNAIYAREAPDVAEDPHFSMQGARYSVMHWRPSTVANATGSQVIDPRTGEILRGEVNVYHNIMDLMRNWYFIQASHLDPRARTLPFPDSLMGRLVQNVITHEVGHAIGFPHNMKSSSLYPADSIRSRTFVERMGGHAPSVMDYARFNYVAQPEDYIPLDLIIPNVGPYDHFAVTWGYRPIPGTRSPDDEVATLNRWASVQDTVPWLRYEVEDATSDHGEQVEAVGDADAVTSSTYALRNLERIVGWLRQTAERPDRDYTTLNELYGEAVTQWGRYMGHVASAVGGAESRERFGTGIRFAPLSRERQRDAVRFLNRNAFHTPAWFRDPELLRRIESEGAVERIRSAQAAVLNNVLSGFRTRRLIEYEATATAGYRPYTVAELLSDVRGGVWEELDRGSVKIDVYRRNLQRHYIAVQARYVVPPTGTAAFNAASDERAIMRGHLIELRRDINNALPRAADAMTRMHLRDLDHEIARVLEARR